MKSLVDKYCFVLNNADVLDKHCKQTLKEVGNRIDELYSETHEFILRRGEGCNFCKKENSIAIELTSDELANIYEGLGDRQGKRYTLKEDEAIIKLRKENYSLKEIGEKVGRTQKSIQNRLSILRRKCDGNL